MLFIHNEDVLIGGEKFYVVPINLNILNLKLPYRYFLMSVNEYFISNL